MSVAALPTERSQPDPPPVDDLSWLTQFASELATRQDFSLPQERRLTGVQVVDLFCGAGGLSAGFEVVGRHTGLCTVVAAADSDEVFSSTFEANIGVAPLVGDLGAIASDRESLSRYVQSLALDRRRPVVLVGGPPCQGFSAHRKRAWDNSDVRNQLVEAYARIAAAIAPDVVVMENVPELLSGRYWGHFEGFRTTMERAGYRVTAGIHNLARFGVAQERFRSLVIAAKRPIAPPAAVLEPSSFRTVRDEISSLPAIAPGEAAKADPMHVCSRHRASTIAVIEQVPLDGGSRPKGIGPQCLERVDGFRDVYGRLAWDRPSVTITGYARNPASGRFIHPAQNRGLSLREAALLQGYPNNFVFRGPMGSRYQQVGNAVPARFAAILAAHIIRAIRDENYATISDLTALKPARDSFSSSLPGLKAKRVS